MRANIRIRSRVSATLSAEQSRTGRRVIADELYGRVCSWAANPTSSDPELEKEFLSRLSGVPTITGDYLKGFRGRYGLGPNQPHPIDFGPPPFDALKVNRYNKEGQQVLYLCDSLQGVARELAREEPVWAQEYSLPIDLRIADFRVSDDSDLLSKVFWVTENAEEEENGYPYRFGQHIAVLVSQRFDGMVVPGVRGSETERYFNIVMLRKVCEWKS